MGLLHIFATVCAAIIHILPHSADACGGLWCTLSQPVNQAAENILFVVDKDKQTVKAVVEIMYDGPSENFAWLLPVPTPPDISVSSNEAFRRLILQTDPQYNFKDTTVEGKCNPQPPIIFLDSGRPVAAFAMAKVEVQDKGTVGPYDYAVISVNPGDETDADVGELAVKWLQEEGYDVFSETSALLGPYLEEGMMLLAFRLTKSQFIDTGSIRPVVLEYEAEKPMIPIRPTAVAANDNMGIRVFVNADGRARPDLPYQDLVINEALIDWFNWRSTYDDVVTAAADEAGGQGFVTELVGNTVDYEHAIFTEDDETWWNDYSAKYENDEFEDGFAAIQEASWRVRFWDGFREVVGQSVDLPETVSLDDFGNNPTQYRDEVQVHLGTFFQLLKADVVEPMSKTQELFNEQDIVTRMYTTMSDDEMTDDPVFYIDKDGALVSNVHEAELKILCSSEFFEWQAPWEITLSDGSIITGEGRDFWPIPLLGFMPVNAKVTQYSSLGQAKIVKNNVKSIKRALKKLKRMRRKELRKKRKERIKAIKKKLREKKNKGV